MRLHGSLIPTPWAHNQIDRVPPNTILVSSAPSDVSQAILGGLMALRLRKIGALGAIIDGRVRDLAELRQVGLPVFSRGVGISAATAVVYPSELDVAVQICLPDGGSITVQPGQIIVGDENGVAVIPSHLEEEVVELLPKLLEQDDEVRRALEEGRTAGEAFKLRNL
jgi:regulator of RNase E activity RraA